ncbi:MAG TPA: (2Fe-2S)-binding protein [Polyangia bacterium]|jgi:sarcosine oxidase subunit beta|nr:(2Fe-2S)-binding protein [Polyangia bacterium]
MPVKVILCRCEDVTLADLEHAVSLGYTHIEEAKRYTGLGTGPCQGKECLVPTCLYLAKATGERPEEIRPFTARPPIAPVALGTLAGATGGGGEDQGGQAPRGKESAS